MFVVIGILVALAQSAEADTNVQLSPAANQLIEQTSDCMDAQVRDLVQKHALDANPEMIVDSALIQCGHMKARFPDPTLADRYFESLRKLYVENVDSGLAEPELAQARSKFVIAAWRTCVTNKAADWSRLNDDAATVAKAAVTSCEALRSNVQTAIGYEFRSKGLKASAAREIADNLTATMTDVATETVISQRAKRLAKP